MGKHNGVNKGNIGSGLRVAGGQVKKQSEHGGKGKQSGVSGKCAKHHGRQPIDSSPHAMQASSFTRAKASTF